MRMGHSQRKLEGVGRSRANGVIGIAMVSVGALLLVGVAGYYAFGFYSTTQLDELNASIEGPLSLPGDDSMFASAAPFTPLDTGASEQNEIVLPDSSVLHGAILPDGSFETVRPVKDISSFTPIDPADDSAARNISTNVENSPTQTSKESGEPQIESPEPSFPVSSYASIYPGQHMHPKYWDAPLWAGTDSFVYGEKQSSPGGFQSVSSKEIPSDLVTSSAKQISIPSLGIESAIEPLNIVEEGGIRRYENPVHIVGSIPGTANPGERGNGWLFGHLESPLKGEGNVFHSLPQVPEYLNNGDPIYLSIENNEGEYLYQIVASKVIPQEELELYETDDSTITLVTCSRRPFYDHRQLVTAKLVGFRELGQTG